MCELDRFANFSAFFFYLQSKQIFLQKNTGPDHTTCPPRVMGKCGARSCCIQIVVFPTTPELHHDYV